MFIHICIYTVLLQTTVRCRLVGGEPSARVMVRVTLIFAVIRWKLLNEPNPRTLGDGDLIGSWRPRPQERRPSRRRERPQRWRHRPRSLWRPRLLLPPPRARACRTTGRTRTGTLWAAPWAAWSRRSSPRRSRWSRRGCRSAAEGELAERDGDWSVWPFYTTGGLNCHVLCVRSGAFATNTTFGVMRSITKSGGLPLVRLLFSFPCVHSSLRCCTPSQSLCLGSGAVSHRR